MYSNVAMPILSMKNY